MKTPGTCQDLPTGVAAGLDNDEEDLHGAQARTSAAATLEGCWLTCDKCGQGGKSWGSLGIIR